MEGIRLVKIKVHNSLALKHGHIYVSFILNDNYLRYCLNADELYFWTKKYDSSVGHLEKDGSLKANYFINLTPLDLKRIKSVGWKELDS